MKRYRRVALVGSGHDRRLAGAGAAAGAAIVERVVGCDRAPEPAERARARGIVDETGRRARARRRDGAELVVLAVPVRRDGAVCEAHRAGASPPAVLVTDVGSTKRDVLRGGRARAAVPGALRRRASDGRHRALGPDAADASAVSRAPLPAHADARGRARRRSSRRARALWRAAGARTSTIVDAERARSRCSRWVSHLPHAAAFALAAAVGADAASAAGLSGGGFVDTTRIAASDPAMWRDIFLANRDALLAALERARRRAGRAAPRDRGRRRRRRSRRWIARARAGRARRDRGTPP